MTKPPEPIVRRLAFRLSPWAPVDSIRLVVLAAVGLLVLLVATWGSSREDAFGSQVGWVHLGVAGFGVSAFGASSWVLRARAVLRSRRQAVFALVDDTMAQPALADDPVAVVVAHPERGRFHRARCLLAATRSWPTAPRAAMVSEGRQPCGVCQP